MQFILVLGYAIGWWTSGGEPGLLLRPVLLLCTAVALGIQSSTVQRFGVPGLSTTYLTGTLTTVVMRLASGHGFRQVQHSIEVIGGLVVGAAAGAGLLFTVRPLTPLLQLIPLSAVVGLAALSARRSRPTRRPRADTDIRPRL